MRERSEGNPSAGLSSAALAKEEAIFIEKIKMVTSDGFAGSCKRARFFCGAKEEPSYLPGHKLASGNVWRLGIFSR